jgi:predicted dehydrogenase
VKISTGLKPDFSLEDNAILVLTYPNALATTEASWTQIGKLTSYSTTLYGSEGTVLIDPDHGGSISLANEEHPEGIELTVPEAARAPGKCEHALSRSDRRPRASKFTRSARMNHCHASQWILEQGIRDARVS